jgi:altronate dehydratase small subunit
MDAIVLNDKDNVATALRPLKRGAMAQIGRAGSMHTLELAEDIPHLHKIALKGLSPGDVVYKYGEAIGAMTALAPPGTVVHVHNLRSRRAQQPRSA